MTSYTLQALPSLKALLHATKYPHSTVIGLLVGTIQPDSITISDAIPLVHHWVDLSPMLEAGLAMADIHVRSKQLRLVGTYIAHSRATVKDLDLVAKKLNESLGLEEAIALVIDNQNLKPGGNPFIPYIRSPTKEWKTLSLNKFTADVPSQWTSSEATVGDFDDHLEDIGIDWLVNPAVVPPT